MAHFLCLFCSVWPQTVQHRVFIQFNIHCSTAGTAFPYDQFK